MRTKMPLLATSQMMTLNGNCLKKVTRKISESRRITRAIFSITKLCVCQEVGGQGKQENSDSDTSFKVVSWKTETLGKITLVAFWFTTPCTLAGGNQYFGGTRCLYRQGRKFGAVCFSKTQGTAYYITRCHNPREHNINFCCR
jgi:hypothetical protein